MLKKIVNSGQRGAEQGALASAFNNNCETGGHIPEGYMIAYGSELKPDESLKVFELQQIKDAKLGECLKSNIDNSDGTVIFVMSNSDITTPEKFAREYCEKKVKPIMLLTINDMISTTRILSFVKNHNIDVLHVTGRIDMKDMKYCFDNVLKQMNDLFQHIKYKRKK